MSSEFDPRPVETPSVQMPESLPRFEGGYEGRRRKMILEDSEQREVSLAFGDNALQTPERIDYTTEVDISGLDSETLGYLDEAQIAPRLSKKLSVLLVAGMMLCTQTGLRCGCSPR